MLNWFDRYRGELGEGPYFAGRAAFGSRTRKSALLPSLWMVVEGGLRGPCRLGVRLTIWPHGPALASDISVFGPSRLCLRAISAYGKHMNALPLREASSLSVWKLPRVLDFSLKARTRFTPSRSIYTTDGLQAGISSQMGARFTRLKSTTESILLSLIVALCRSQRSQTHNSG